MNTKDNAIYQQKCKVKISTISGSVTGVFLDGYPCDIEQKTEKLVDAIAYGSQQAVTVDTQEFRDLMAFNIIPHNIGKYEHVKARGNFIDHIDAHTSAAVARAREEVAAHQQRHIDQLKAQLAGMDVMLDLAIAERNAALAAQAAPVAASDLHAQIMNLQSTATMSHFASIDDMRLYERGHHDGCRAAAKLLAAHTQQEAV